MKTFSIKKEEIKKKWLLIDANQAVLGRLAVISAIILRGKNKPDYTPNQDFNGADTFSFTVTDGTWTSVVGVVTVNVSPVNDTPVLEFIEDGTVNEDNNFMLTMFADDVDGDDLTFDAVVDGNATVSIDGNYLTISPSENFNGDILVDITVGDGELTDMQTFMLTVIPINDSIAFAPISNQTTQEDTPLTFDLDIVDIDGPFLVLNYEHTGNVEISFISNSITITPYLNWFGSTDITIIAFDGEFTAEQSFTLDVVSVNDIPVISAIANQQINEDTFLTLNLSAADIEGDDLSFSALSGESYTAQVSGNVLTVTPVQDFNGDLDITVSVYDGQDFDSTEFTLSVLPVNDAPVVLNAIGDVTLLEDADSFDIDISSVFYDVDGDALDLSLENGETSIVINDFILTIYLPQDFNGSDNVIVTATDGQESISTSFGIDVTPVNDAPILGNLSSDETDEDVDYVLELSATDVDQDDLEFSASVNANGVATIDGSTLTVSLDDDYYGSIEVTIVVSDGSLSDTGTFTLTVNPVNDAPVFSDIADQNIDEDSVFEYSLVASDVDGDNLYYSAEIDGNGSLSIVDNQLSIVPDLNFYGEIEVTVSVTDTQLSDTITFILYVSPVNDAPVIEALSNQSINEDESLTLDLVASDVDFDNLVFSVSLDGQATSSVNGNILTITPDENWYGDINASVTVSDGIMTDSDDFVLTVLSVNDAPVV